MHGVEFTFKRDGAFYFFTPYTLVTGIVNAVVLVSLPVPLGGSGGIVDMQGSGHAYSCQQQSVSVRMAVGELGARCIDGGTTELLPLGQMYSRSPFDKADVEGPEPPGP